MTDRETWRKISRRTRNVIISRDDTEFRFGIYERLPVGVSKQIIKKQEELANDEGTFDSFELFIEIMPLVYPERPEGFEDDDFLEADTDTLKKFAYPIKDLLEREGLIKTGEEQEDKEENIEKK